MYDAVKEVMTQQNAVANAAAACARARSLGATIIHAPISFAADASDNPNSRLGTLAGCKCYAFLRSPWGREFTFICQ